MNRQITIGKIKRKYIYKHRMIYITSLYILSIPLKNNKITGNVVAYNVNNGWIEWTCDYEDGFANGTYTHYKNGSIQCSYKYCAPMINLRNVANTCAEMVLNS